MFYNRVPLATLGVLTATLIIISCLSPNKGLAGDDPLTKEQHLKLAREAEKDFQAAVDDWPAATQPGGNVAAVQRRIAAADYQRVRHMLDGGEIPNAAVLVPDQIAFAGSVTLSGGKTCSLVIGRGQAGLIASVWPRGNDRRTEGFIADIWLSGLKESEISVRYAQIATENGRTIYRIPYTLHGRDGTIDLVTAADDDQWKFRPDVGRVTEGNWWHVDEAASPTSASTNAPTTPK